MAQKFSGTVNLDMRDSVADGDAFLPELGADGRAERTVTPLRARQRSIGSLEGRRQVDIDGLGFSFAYRISEGILVGVTVAQVLPSGDGGPPRPPA
jgi:hypothetical protein